MQKQFSAAGSVAVPAGFSVAHPVHVTVAPALTRRNRLTCAFRPILALPHILLVGGPIAFAMSFQWHADEATHLEWTGGGVFGGVSAVIAIIAWFAIVFGARYPEGLWNLAALYLRWRVRAVTYLMLLRDEYPPFGDGAYAAELTLPQPETPRDRVTVAFRIFLALPHLVVLWVLGTAWGIATLIAWVSILFTANYPPRLYEFAVGVLRWSTRVESYLLLLRDEYPPFTLD
jgi:steroid 5-alpha reductase family enzyme